QAGHDAVCRTGYPIEEPQGGDGLVVRGPGGLLVIEEEEDVAVGMVEAELVGRLAEVQGVGLEVHDVDLDGPRRAVAELEVLDEALAQRGHAWAPGQGESGGTAPSISQQRPRRKSERPR